MSISIAIVDKCNDSRKQLEDAVQACKGLKLVCSCSSGEEALIKLSVSRPEVVILDPDLAGITGIETMRSLRDYFPSMLFIIFSDDNSEEKIFEAIHAGANGFRLKKDALHYICQSVKDVHEGGAAFCSSSAIKIAEAVRKQTQTFEKSNSLKKLTDRELQILDSLSKGMVYKEMGEKLGITPETVRKHVYSIYSKLNVNNRVAAVNKYYGR